MDNSAGGASGGASGSVTLPLITYNNSAHRDELAKLSMVPRRARKAAGYWECLNQSQVPMFQRRYCVVEHYRPGNGRIRFALMSCFRLHNETGNIWSHLIGALLMGVLALCFSLAILTPADIYTLLTSGQLTPNSARLARAGISVWPLIVFDVASSLTLLLSAAAHTFSCLSANASAVFWKLDQLGIAAGIFSMYFPGVMYLFYRYPTVVKHSYLLGMAVVAVICACLGITSFAITRPMAKRCLRVTLYFILSACSLVPLSQIFAEQTEETTYRATILRYFGCFLTAAAGALMYASGIPERLAPGRFDLLGSSHQLFHTAIVACFIMYHCANADLWQFLAQQELDDDMQAAVPNRS